MGDRLAEIRARLARWEAAEADPMHAGSARVERRLHLPSTAEWENARDDLAAHAPDDLAYLLAEADRLADYARAADEAVGVVSAERDEARADLAEAAVERERLDALLDAARVGGANSRADAAALRDLLRRAREYVEPGDLADRIAEALGEARPEATELAPCLCTACDWTGEAIRGAPCPACGGAMAWEWRRHKWGDKCVDPNCQRAHHLLTDEQLRDRAARVAEEAAIRRECERVGIPAPGEWETREGLLPARWWPEPDGTQAVVVSADGGWTAWAFSQAGVWIVGDGDDGGRLAADRALLAWLRAQPDGGTP